MSEAIGRSNRPGDFQTSIDVIGCTFVGCATDILLVQPCQFHGSAYVVNSIATVTSQAPPCDAIEINDVSGPGLVDANGFVVPGSLAEGGGNPYLVPEEYCGVNIGRDQPDPCRFVRVDMTGDGLVDGADLGALPASWGHPNVAADFNVDGVINGSDLGTLLAYWP